MIGLGDETIARFMKTDPRLGLAIDRALATHRDLRGAHEAGLRGSETDLVRALQDGYLNFYSPHSVNPYVPLGAAGPWVVTSHGGVLHDSGGYGMLGFGHAPAEVLAAISTPLPMANIMTPTFSQLRLMKRLRAEVGQRRGGSPYAQFLLMNSGSEAVAVAARIADTHARSRTDPGGPDAAKPRVIMSLRGSFHGRTAGPARFSDSTRAKYTAHLASFRDADPLRTVPINDVDALRAAFAQADADGVFVEAFFAEPVMGEGNPGVALERPFYDVLRELTRERGTLFLIDSIQAGLRAHGVLSLVDYPGFEDADPPDMETYSKALNAGQFPMSVLAMQAETAAIYQRGTYGNTMTGNPRGLEAACAVLDALTPELRANIVARGAELKQRLNDLRSEFPAITRVEGTGLLVSVGLDPDAYTVVGHGGLEEWLRLAGFGVIHGGKNALRFTPTFRITSPEIELLVDGVRAGLRALKRVSA